MLSTIHNASSDFESADVAFKKILKTSDVDDEKFENKSQHTKSKKRVVCCNYYPFYKY